MVYKAKLCTRWVRLLSLALFSVKAYSCVRRPQQRPLRVESGDRERKREGNRSTCPVRSPSPESGSDWSGVAVHSKGVDLFLPVTICLSPFSRNWWREMNSPSASNPRIDKSPALAWPALRNSPSFAFTLETEYDKWRAAKAKENRNDFNKILLAASFPSVITTRTRRTVEIAVGPFSLPRL